MILLLLKNYSKNGKQIDILNLILMKDIGIPDVSQQEISLENNLKNDKQIVKQTHQMKQVLLAVILLIFLLAGLLFTLVTYQGEQQTSKDLQASQQLRKNQKAILQNSIDPLEDVVLANDNQNQSYPIQTQDIQSQKTTYDHKNKTMTQIYSQNLIKSWDIYSFLKKRIAVFSNHLSPYLKMGSLARKELLGKSQINVEQFGMAVEQMTFAPLILNNSEKISHAIKTQKNIYETRYNISSYPQFEFCVVVPTYKNTNKFRYFMNLYTIMQQDYDRFHVVIIDDASEDHTADKIQKEINQNPFIKEKVTLIRNKKRQFHMANIYFAVYNYCKPGQILTIVDGDDELVGKQVFKIINAAYHRTKAFTIYSNYIESKKDVTLNIGISKAYPPQVIETNSFRQTIHYYSHLKTAWVDLFLQIKEESLKSNEGKWYNNAVDNAIFLSIFQMACGRILYLPEITYKYNTFTGNSVGNMDYNFRKATADEIKAKPKYRCINQTRPDIFQKLESYFQ